MTPQPDPFEPVRHNGEAATIRSLAQSWAPIIGKRIDEKAGGGIHSRRTGC
jgi:hypothetical protein